MKKHILFTTALLVFIYAKCEAQKIFSEGILKYDVFINNEDKPSGLYVISVKGGNIKRELAMNNGFNNITIYTVKNGKTLSLNLNDGNKYALEMSQEEVNEKNLKFSNAQFVDLNKQKKIKWKNYVAINFPFRAIFLKKLPKRSPIKQFFDI